MKENILIVEDEFIVANDLRLTMVKAGYSVCGIAASVKEAREMIESKKPTWVLLDIFLQDGSMGTELSGYLTAKNIGFIYISANTNQSVLESAKATQPYGFLVKPFREKDLLIMLEIAMEKHRQGTELTLQKELLLQKQVGLLVESSINTEQKIKLIPGAFQALVPFDYMKITCLKNDEIDELSFLRTGFDEYQITDYIGLANIMGLTTQEQNKFRPKLSDSSKSEYYNGKDFHRLLLDDYREKRLSDHLRLESKVLYAIKMENGETATLTFYSRKAENYSQSHLNLLAKSAIPIKALIGQLQNEVKNAPEKRLAARKADSSINRTPEVNLSQAGFEGIIGNSPVLLRVLDNVGLVARSNVSVLILGESGTGKERVAQSIHNLSARKNKPIITVNCAAIPRELVESELFGHERGAFTGASEKRIGKFELAQGGTIFLDEIGELPLDAQVKLLRVLQEREIESVGGSRTVKVDVRIIAATNRKLEKEVAEGRFRLDLYYRLNVFPIELPSLRDRKADIPLLAAHFLAVYNKEMGKDVKGFSTNAQKQLESYGWPGNIRELGHVVERSLVLTTGDIINEIHLAGTVKDESNNMNRPFQLMTLEKMEAEHIIGVLKNCNGKVCGSGGAAEILGLPPSTLNSKIKKLGIKRESFFNM
jgi:DNA-binding NtrC family response regulator